MGLMKKQGKTIWEVYIIFFVQLTYGIQYQIFTFNKHFDQKNDCVLDQL